MQKRHRTRFGLVALVILGVLIGCGLQSTQVAAPEGALVNIDQPIGANNPAGRPAGDNALAAPPQRVQTEMNGLQFAITRPQGWVADTADGLVMAEHMTGLDTDETRAGVLVYIFAPSAETPLLTVEQEAAAANYPLAVLRQVVTMPQEIGRNVMATQPSAFMWGEKHAAYYLLTGGDGTHTIVLAVETGASSAPLLVINASAPTDQGERLRRILPDVLADLAIENGGGEPLLALPADALHTLPNPLPFPTMAPEGGGMMGGFLFPSVFRGREALIALIEYGYENLSAPPRP